MAKRHRIPHKRSKRMFSKHAAKTHKRNVPPRIPMRGGIRL